MEMASLEAKPFAEQSTWFVVYTKSRHEKRIAAQLEERAIDYFLPVYRSMRKWKDRRVTIEMPLFPGYVFVHVPVERRLRVLQLPGVVRAVTHNGLPATLSGQEVEHLRAGLSQVAAAPHPYLTVGRRVRICAGPLTGFTGILVRRKTVVRVVIAVELIQRAIVVDVDAKDVQPL